MATLPTPKWQLEPGFTPRWTPAPALAQWPPAAYRARHRVALGENWLSIAHDNLVADAWDLIHFNFGTEDPRKVNWYLRHYVGCWAAAPDGKNFAFTDHDDPGVVYVPPHGYTRATGLPFNALVLSQLEKSARHFPYVVLHDFHINLNGLGKLLTAMRQGRIAAVHDPGIDSPAQYRSSKRKDGPAIAMRGASMVTWLSRTILVHEAVHAIVDCNRFENIAGWENEFLAYAVEALWGRAEDDAMAERMVTQVLDDPDITHNAYVLAHYLKHAGKMFYGQFIMRVRDVDAMLPDYRDPRRTLNPFANLKAAVMREYKATARKRTTFDGV